MFSDVVAGITLWAIFSSQALAYSRLAHATPVAGLVTAIAGALVYGALGSSFRISIGPAGGICAIVGATVAHVPALHLASSIAAMTLMSAAVLFLAGLLRITFLQRLFPVPVFVGYLAGTGATILYGQSKDLLTHGTLPLAIGLMAIGGVLLLGKVAPRVPAPFVVLTLATIAGTWLDPKALGVPVIGDAVGHFGQLSLPTGLGWPALSSLVIPSLSIALFLYVDSLANADAFAREGDPPIRLRREYFALGAVNLAAGLFGGFVAGCSTSRSAVAEHAGARGRLAPVVAGLLLLLTSLSVVRFLQPLPLAALSGVVFVAALGLIDVKKLKELRALRRPDFRIALVAACGVAFVGPMWGVGLGVAAALFETLRRAMEPERQVLAPGSGERYYEPFVADALPVTGGLVIYRFGAPLFFGNAETFVNDMREVARSATASLQTLVVNADALGVPDATAREALVKARDVLDERGIRLVFGNVRAELRAALEKAGTFVVIDENEFIRDLRQVRGTPLGAE